MSIFDALNAQLDLAAEKISDWIMDSRRTNEDYITILTFSLCMNLIKTECTMHPEIKFFTLSAEHNNTPKNKYDNVIVTLSMLDAECNVLLIDTTECKYVMHAGELDEEIISLLGGKQSVTAAIDFTGSD